MKKACSEMMEGRDYTVEKYSNEHGYWYLIKLKHKLAVKGPFKTEELLNDALTEEITFRGLTNNR
jgi:hypothetical protein